MKKTYRRCFLTAFAALLIVVALPVPSAFAQSLDAMRASGAIGERFDGFATVRNGGGNAQALVRDVNAQRRGIYAKRAAEQGISVDQVGRVYANQIFQNAAKGTWFQNANGSWRQK